MGSRVRCGLGDGFPPEGLGVDPQKGPVSDWDKHDEESQGWVLTRDRQRKEQLKDWPFCPGLAATLVSPEFTH